VPLIEMMGVLLQALQIAILIRVLYSWVDPNPYPTNTFKRLLWAVTDPLLNPLRRFIPPMGMIDFTPLVAIVLLSVVQRVLFQTATGPF